MMMQQNAVVGGQDSKRQPISVTTNIVMDHGPKLWSMSFMIRRIILVLCLSLLGTAHAKAQGLIRDAEIERSLKLIAEPLLNQAGLPVNSTKILIVNDPKMNAFVTNGRTIFINYGLILKLDTVEQLQAVIAHEIAHITGGHYGQRVAQIANSRSAAGLGLLLSAAAAVAGAPEAAVGLAAGSRSSSTRHFFANTRDQEAAADRVGLRLMASAGIRPSAAIEVLEHFKDQDLRNEQQRDPYAITHPLTSVRIKAAMENIKRLPKGAAPSDEAVYWYARMQSKFLGFTGNPKFVLQSLSKSEQSEAAIYARAIAYHKNAQTQNALRDMDRLLDLRPDDAYYVELKGQILLEANQASAAIPYYKRAAEILPDEALITAGLGRAYLSTNQPKEALPLLQRAYRTDQRNAGLLRDLGRTYGLLGQDGLASVAYSERAAMLGDIESALLHARRAQNLLRQGTTGWLRAEDIIVAFGKKQVQKQRR